MVMVHGLTAIKEMFLDSAIASRCSFAKKGTVDTMALIDDVAQGVIQIGGVRLPLMGTGRIYICGITPYETTHLGHAATFIGPTWPLGCSA